jgi:hypothetical protein
MRKVNPRAKPPRGLRRASFPAGKPHVRDWTLLTLTTTEAYPSRFAYVPGRALLIWPPSLLQPWAFVIAGAGHFSVPVVDAPAALRERVASGNYVGRWLCASVTLICKDPQTRPG